MLTSTPYFAYGSNLNHAEMRRRCPGARAATPARLEGWRLTFRGVADIEPAAGRTVHGGIWWLGDENLQRLDDYEGAPTHYRRETLEVLTPAGRLAATTYVMTESSYLGLPSPLYLDRIEVGFRDWGLPLAELRAALAEARAELAAFGVQRYGPDGRKRLRAILDQG